MSVLGTFGDPGFTEMGLVEHRPHTQLAVFGRNFEAMRPVSPVQSVWVPETLTNPWLERQYACRMTFQHYLAAQGHFSSGAVCGIEVAVLGCPS